MEQLSHKEIAYIEACQEELRDLIITLCRIPAPSNQEDLRAAFVKDWLIQCGAADVYIDQAKNVVLPLNIENKNGLSVMMAHTDTVFPDLKPFEPKIAEGRIYCPGVGDDTTNLAQMLLIIRYILQNDLIPANGVVFVANSCEEGLGNLKGSKQIMADYAGRVAEFTSFDGGYDEYVDFAVGSKRYEVTVETEGGHSYGSYGNRNAIHYMASLIDTLYTLKVPNKGKSTYNVGVINGGTSVNTIAQKCTMLFEYRSDSREDLAMMDAFFHKAIEAYRAMGVSITVDLVGDRPCMGEVDAKAEEAMRNRLKEIVRCYTGKEISSRSGSTDCNVPLSMGIPSICFGGYDGAGAHTREEYIELNSLETGMKIMMAYILKDFR